MMNSGSNRPGIVIADLLFCLLTSYSTLSAHLYTEVLKVQTDTCEGIDQATSLCLRVICYPDSIVSKVNSNIQANSRHFEEE